MQTSQRPRKSIAPEVCTQATNPSEGSFQPQRHLSKTEPNVTYRRSTQPTVGFSENIFLPLVSWHLGGISVPASSGKFQLVPASCTKKNPFINRFNFHNHHTR